jgi:hypothetical protein
MLDAKEVMAAQERMESARLPFERAWQESAELFLPRQADFNDPQGVNRGRSRANIIYDSYGVEAMKDGVSVFEGYVMPKGALWELLVAPVDIPELGKLQHVAAWYERKTQRLHQLRNNAMSGFVTETNESAASLLAFGNQGMEVDRLRDPVTRGLIGMRYRSEFLGRLYWQDNWQGIPARRHIKFRWTAGQALERFGKEALERAPQLAKAAADPKLRDKTDFEFLRAIVPNSAIDTARLDWRGKPWVQGILAIADKEFLEIGGYRAPPITISRFAKSPTEEYGRGPGTDLLPDIKAVQAIMIDLMVGAEMGLRPPLGAPDDATDMLINYAAAMITYGAIDRRGNRLVQPLFEVGDGTMALEVQKQLRALIDRGFFRHLLLSSQEIKSHVNDAQLYERMQEKGVLLQPLARQETEWFTPMLDRETEIMAEAGEFDDMPGEVREAQGARSVMYDNPLNRALRAERAGGYFRALDKVVAVAQYRPEALDSFFREYPLEKAIPGIGDIEAIPAEWRATDSEKRAFDAAKARQKQMQEIQQLAETTEPVARAAKDFSQATAVA